jgi:hypothetical protein
MVGSGGQYDRYYPHSDWNLHTENLIRTLTVLQVC